MEVILLEKVDNLGNLGDKVEVRPGFGRNFLIPQGKAVRATPERIKEFEAQRAELEKAEAEAIEGAKKRQSAFEDAAITITAKVAGEGQLYGSVSTAEIAEAMVEAGYEVERRELRLPGEGAIREVGEYDIVIHLHSDVDATVRLTVEGEE